MFRVFLVLFLCARSVLCICPADFITPPLIVVSLDGFRAEYLNRRVTPRIQALREEGISVSHMKASYPTLTFPNHYTIATGLYPESHGIIANSFYDADFNATFSIGSDESLKGRWWGGEPIWSTVRKQGKVSGTVYWVGSEVDIGGMRPNYYFPYNSPDQLPFKQRVGQILSWLQLPKSQRPDWMCVYFKEPDSTGHWYGPNSPELQDKLIEMDGYVGQLVDGIDSMNLTDCVNLIVVSDHGMADAGPERVIILEDYVPELDKKGMTFEGSFPRIELQDNYKDEKDHIRSQLSCQQKSLQQYSSQELPTRLHFSNNKRIEDIVLNLGLGYEANVQDHSYLEGNHGYDNYYDDMQAIFVARGPDFASGLRVEPFNNIELYNLMCVLVGVQAGPNNGTEGALYHLLSSPPEYPKITKQLPPPFASYPSSDDIPNLKNTAGCPGDKQAPLNFNFTLEQKAVLLNYHLPWGSPHSPHVDADALQLHHQDHVTAFSRLLKVPFWTSFTTDASKLSGRKMSFAWASDVRLLAENSPTCQDYERLSASNFTMHSLFPKTFSKRSIADQAFLVSNAVPLSQSLLPHWRHLINILLRGVLSHKGVTNIIAGPVYDHNADSLVDDITKIHPVPSEPSHLFLVVTWCASKVSALPDCPKNDIDASAFIMPQNIAIINCMSGDEFALLYGARVRDVELATGLVLLPSLPPQTRTKTILRIHTSLPFANK